MHYAASKKETELELTGVEKLRADADTSLELLQKGGAVDTVDLDPRVAPLLLERAAAQRGLEYAQSAAQAALKAEDAIKAALDAFARSDAFVLNEGLLQGSLRKSMQGQPVLLGLNFASFGTEHHMDLAFSFNDQQFNSRQLTALGLFVASKFMGSAYAKDLAMEPVLKLVHGAYAAAHASAKSELDKVLKEHRIAAIDGDGAL